MFFFLLLLVFLFVLFWLCAFSFVMSCNLLSSVSRLIEAKNDFFCGFALLVCYQYIRMWQVLLLA